jgi:hypothetical protein
MGEQSVAELVAFMARQDGAALAQTQLLPVGMPNKTPEPSFSSRPPSLVQAPPSLPGGL